MSVCTIHGHGFSTCALLKAVLMCMPIVSIVAKFNGKRSTFDSISDQLNLSFHINSSMIWCDTCCIPTACDHKKKVTITLLQADVDEIKQEYDSRHMNSTYTIICNFAALNHSKLWRENLSVRTNKIYSLCWLITKCIIISIECS